MTGPAILIAVPVLRRPHRVVPLLQSIRSATSEPYRVVFIGNAGDDGELDTVRAAGADLLVQPYAHDPADWRTRPGEWARKLNRAYRESDEPLIFCGADDLHFHPGWADAVRRCAERPGVGVIGTNDLTNPGVMAGEFSTHPVVVRSYADEFGTIDEPGVMLHEGYPHEWVDRELAETAKARGAWAFAAGAHVEHLHATVGKAPMDPLYSQQRRRMVAGKLLFDQRRLLWEQPWKR
jgi:hypothetical protein